MAAVDPMTPNDARVEMFQKGLIPDSFFNMKALAPRDRPLSTATEMFDDDTDFEYDDGSDGDEEPQNGSPRFSLHSSGRRSETTLSSFEELNTPISNNLRGFDFQIEITERVPDESSQQMEMRSVEGPRGPHLFRASQDMKPQAEEYYLTMSPVTPRHPSRPETAFRFLPPPIPDQTPSPRTHRPISTMTEVLDTLDKAEVAKWSPKQVARWMYGAGFEPSIVEKFDENDISGAILVTLKFEDLRELDIPSFGKRTKLWNEIDQLRGGGQKAQPPSPTVIECESSDDEEDQPKRKVVQRRRARPGIDEIISPLDSVSFVGFEQLMPKPHRCAKGENCTRWKKQQRLINAFNKEHPISPMGGTFMVAGNPGNPMNAEAVRPFSDLVPSVVASSDVLGPGTPAFRQLEASTLAQIQQRDAQDNVKQFLTFQHVDELWAPEEPATPPYEMFPPIVHSTQTLAQQARADPRGPLRLSIPSNASPARSASAMETFSPGPMERVSPLSPRLRNFPANSSNTHKRTVSPPSIPLHRFGTPASVSDVPYTISRFSQLPAPSRDASQSVPPNMAYRPPMPLQRSASRSSRRRESSNLAILPALSEAAESQTPSNHHNNNAMYNTFAHSRDNSFDSGYSNGGQMFSDAVVSRAKARAKEEDGHSGWMKKRKTRMLRHEWHEHHFTLRGTKLSMHKDARCAETLESIDVDDFSIACSSLSSTSKLNAAMKAMGLSSGTGEGKKSGRHGNEDVAAFSFQLIPDVVEKARGMRRMMGAGKAGETHHFAVRSRDERIDWMRELMLAKALRAKEEGGEVCVNGNMI